MVSNTYSIKGIKLSTADCSSSVSCGLAALSVLVSPCLGSGAAYLWNACFSSLGLSAYFWIAISKAAVVISKIAPAFEQIGGGLQYELPYNIKKLEELHYIKEIK